MTPLLAFVFPVALQAAPSASAISAPLTTGGAYLSEQAQSRGVVAPERTLTLAQAVQNALRRQPQIRQAQAVTEAAEGRVQQARSGLLPQVVASAAYQRTTGNFAPRPGSVLVTSASNVTTGTQAAPSWSSTTYNYFTFGLNATQLIYDFGQTPERWHAAQANTDALRASEHATELQAVLTVHKIYFQAWAQKSLIKVATETLSNQETHLRQIQGFVGVGTRPEIDLAQARTDVANARVQLIMAQNAYEVAKAQLNQAMGVINSTDYDVAEEEVAPLADEDQSMDQLVAKALAVRPEVASLRKQRQAQELTIRSIKGAYGPTLAASAGATESGIALEGLVPNWNVGAAVTWPLFQGGLTKGQVHEAEANLQNVQAQLDAIQLQVRFEIEQARLTVRAAKVSITAAQDALSNARERLRLAEGRYQAGAGSVIELGDAQVALTNAAAQVVQAQYNLATARAELLTALGRR